MREVRLLASVAEVGLAVKRQELKACSMCHDRALRHGFKAEARLAIEPRTGLTPLEHVLVVIRQRCRADQREHCWLGHQPPGT